MAILSRAAILSFLLFANFIFAAEKIDINTAPLEELVKIVHIGKLRALELISLRPFSSLDELTKIKGIGASRLKDIKEQGLAWIELESEQPEPQPEPQPIAYPSPAAIAKQSPKPSSSSFVPLIALTVAIFSGLIILILKKGVKIS